MSDVLTRRRAPDPVWAALCARLAQVGFENLAHHDQVFMAVSNLKMEVENGGFAQYMFNSYGERAELALAGLREMGASGAATACEGFFALLPGKMPVKDRDAREKQLHAAAKALGAKAWEKKARELDRQFYAAVPELKGCLLAYAQKHNMVPDPA